MTAAAGLVAAVVVVAWIAVPAPSPVLRARRRRVPPRPAVLSWVAVVGLAVLGAVAVPGVPWLGLPAAVLTWAWGPLQRRRRRTAEQEAVEDALPELLDLLALAVGAGLTPAAALEVVGRRGGGPLAAALGDAVATATAEGRMLTEVLDAVPARLGPGGDAARAVVAVLADAVRHGTALGPALDRLGDEARARRRRRAESRARRVPVLLLFPLVTCTLPALALLTVVPLLVGSLRALRST